MPVHDWTQVSSGLFHEFHQSWSVRIMDALNSGVLTEGCFALVEPSVQRPEPDVIAVQTRQPDRSGDSATLDLPKARQIFRTPSDAALYARKANRISVRHPLGHIVAVIEIVSPGNKDSRHSLRSFVEKAVTFVRNGIHLLIVDLFPPAPDRDPQGIHKAIWDEFADAPFELPADRPLTLVAYQSSDDYTAYLEFVGVGDSLPDMPLFLTRDAHVPVPLEATYEATWAVCPAPIRELVQPVP